MAKRRRRMDPEFKPDPRSATAFKTLRLTRQQQLRLLKWGLYILTMILALVIQDVIMSRVRLLGATTDLAVSVILLLAMLEGTEVGSLFLLIASTLYFFSGSAPGAYSIGLMTFFGVAAVMFRQMYLSRSRGSMVLCAGAAQMAYELGLYGVGLFLGLTRWDRIGSFVLTGVYSVLVMIPLYPLLCKIGLIGGNTWKE